MAFLKLNIFHWHLTEDQGWRIEIKKYPKLTEIGSKRGKIQPSLIFSSKRGFKPVPQGLFYTQTDIQGNHSVCDPTIYYHYPRN